MRSIWTRRRCSAAARPPRSAVPAGFTGWRLTFGGAELPAAIAHGGALATVVQDPLSSVFVLLYDVAPADDEALRFWRGQSYRSLKVRIETLEGSVMAWTFVLDAYEGGLPSARYLGDLGDAAELAGAPSDYVQELRLRPCRSNP